MPSINLKNIIIQKKEDKNFNPYFLIVDKDSDEKYTCFKWSVKENWQTLLNSWEDIKEIELDYIEKEQDGKIYKNVVDCYFLQEGEVII